jgi:FkbM family methyltransferase
MKEYYYFKNTNYPIWISDETCQLTPHTFLNDNTMWEEDSIKYFFGMIPKDKAVNIIDIGAQSGLYSLYAKYLPVATFFSFEPFKPTFDLLNENIELNHISNVDIYNIGISNKKETTVLNTSISHNGLHTMGNNPLRFNDICQVSIDVDTLDHLFYDKNISVDFIKIDTEGWEYNILKGGENTIKQYKPIIQLEWNEINMKQCSVDPNEFNEYLTTRLKYKKLKIINEELFIGPI